MADREKLKQELLEELKTEYIMTPIKQKALITRDITDKYEEQICNKCDVPAVYEKIQGINNAIRKVVALHFGFYSTKDIGELEDRQAYRAELERFIKEYILQEDKR